MKTAKQDRRADDIRLIRRWLRCRRTMSIAEASAAVGYSAGWLYRLAWACEIDPRSNPPRDLFRRSRVTEAGRQRRAIAARMVAEGKTLAEIGAALGVRRQRAWELVHDVEKGKNNP